jgi:hypothetical protein
MTDALTEYVLGGSKSKKAIAHLKSSITSIKTDDAELAALIKGFKEVDLTSENATEEV